MTEQPKHVSILQEWVTGLGLRYQGTLLTIIRGCDIAPKYAAEKALIREMRGLILKPFDARELEVEKGFMTKFCPEWSAPAFESFRKNIDAVPVHYVMHILHAVEIIGYTHPRVEVRTIYLERYYALTRQFHLNVETFEQLHARLSEDRVALRTVDR